MSDENECSREESPWGRDEGGDTVGEKERLERARGPVIEGA